MYQYSNHCRLRQPLHAWTTNITQDKTWIWWYDRATHSLWQRTEDQTWSIWESHSFNCKSFTHSRHAPSTQGYHPVRCSVSPGPVYVRLLNWDHDLQTPAPPPIPNDFSDHLQLLPATAHWALQSMVRIGNMLELSEALQSGTAVAVSDGSYKLNLGTSAFIVTTPGCSSHVRGANRVPGPLKEGDSYRCELAGLYGIILTVNALCQAHGISSGKCTIACDNDSAIRVCMPGFIPEPSQDSFDLVNAIWHIKQASPIQWQAQYVDGHKDDVTCQLTFLEQLNVHMDSLAKAYWMHLSQDPATWEGDNSIPIHGEGWQLWNGTTKVRSTSRPDLYSIIQNPITVNYWVRHGRVPSEATHLIDWHSNGQALRSMKLGKRRRVCKHASGDCGVGTTLAKWKLQDDDHCPRCGQSEDTIHVLRCPEATDTWDTAVIELQASLTALDTDPEIETVILSAISSWHADTAPTAPQPGLNPLLLQAYDHQSLIGWFPFIEGLISYDWTDAQAIHYANISSSCSGKQWSKQLIKHIHHLTDTMWQHRNDIKHNLSQPRQKRMRRLLDLEITRELIQGPADLPRGDASRLFQRNLVSLLQQSTNYKQAWLFQTAQARQRHQRQREHNDELETISLTHSKLFKWAQTGIAT